MGSKKERLRTLRNRGWPHSMNQRARKYERDYRESGFGSRDKADKLERRREKEQEFSDDYQFGMGLLGSRRRFQISRALLHVFEEKAATPQDMDYITRQGKVLERYDYPEGIEHPEALEELPEVIITLVDFAPQNSKNLS